MKNARKMILVDFDEAAAGSQTVKSDESFRNASSDFNMMDLKREMKGVLNSRNKNDRDKLLLYNRLQRRYSSLKDQATKSEENRREGDMKKFISMLRRNQSHQSVEDSDMELPTTASTVVPKRKLQRKLTKRRFVRNPQDFGPLELNKSASSAEEKVRKSKPLVLDTPRRATLRVNPPKRISKIQQSNVRQKGFGISSWTLCN